MLMMTWSAFSLLNTRVLQRKMLNVAEIQNSVLYYLSEFEKLSTYVQQVTKDSQVSWVPPSEDT